MPTSTDLMGVGLPAQLSITLGKDPKSVACAGTTQGTATTVLTHNSELVTGASTTGAILQSAALIGTPWYFFNSTATTAKVYAPSGHNMNGSLNGSVSIAQNQGCFVWQYKKGSWASVLTA